MLASDLTATALQSNPVRLSRVFGVTPLPDGTEAANRAAAASVLKVAESGRQVWLAAGLFVAVVIFNTIRARKRG